MNNKREQNANSNVPTGGFTDQQLQNIENSGNPLTGATNTFHEKSATRPNPANNYDNLSSSIEPDEIADKDEYIDEP